jgi:hypothetical protein
VADEEPDMVDFVRAKAAAAGAEDVRPIVSSAESLDAEPDYFELVVIGNAFHRLDRELAAGRKPDLRRPGAVSSPLSIAGGCRSSPGTSGRCPSFRPLCSAIRLPHSMPTSLQGSARTATAGRLLRP